MKTAISLPDALFERVDRTAKSLGISRSELFQRAVREFLDHCEQDEVSEALDRLYRPGGEDSSLHPAVRKAQLAALPREDWEQHRAIWS
jgi:predicted transcriptional regulator